MNKFKRWVKGLLSAFIHGATAAALSYGGLSAAHGLGVDVPILKFKGLGIVMLSGGILPLIKYLNEHPLPDEEKVTSG